MLWIDQIKEFGNTLWENGTLRKITAAGTQLAIKTSQGVIGQIGAIPGAIYSTFTKPKTQLVIKHAGQIVAKDLLPYITVKLMNETLHTYLQQDDDDPYQSLTASMAIQTTLMLSNAVASMLAFRLRTSIALHAAMLMKEATDASKEVNVNTHDICATDKCSKLKFIKGSFRDIVAYYCTDVAIEFIGTIPYLGKPLEVLLRIDQTGRYALTVVTPDMCNKHQMQYLQQEQGLALSLGITQWLISHLINNTIGNYAPFIPSIYYEPLVDKLVLVGQINVAAHMTLPRLAPKIKGKLALPNPGVDNSLYLPNPIDLYQGFIGIVFDVAATGIKMTLRKLPPQQNEVDWLKIGRIIHGLLNNSLINKVKPILLPALLQNNHGLGNDALFNVNFKLVILEVIRILYAMESIREHWGVQTGQWLLSSKQIAYIMWVKFGTPKLPTKILLEVIKNDKLMEALHVLRLELESIVRHSQAPVSIDSSGVPLRTPLENEPELTQEEQNPPEEVQVQRYQVHSNSSPAGRRTNRSGRRQRGDVHESGDLNITRQSATALLASSPDTTLPSRRRAREGFTTADDLDISRQGTTASSPNTIHNGRRRVRVTDDNRPREEVVLHALAPDAFYNNGRRRTRATVTAVSEVESQDKTLAMAGG